MFIRGPTHSLLLRHTLFLHSVSLYLALHRHKIVGVFYCCYSNCLLYVTCNAKLFSERICGFGVHFHKCEPIATKFGACKLCYNRQLCASFQCSRFRMLWPKQASVFFCVKFSRNLQLGQSQVQKVTFLWERVTFLPHVNLLDTVLPRVSGQC